MPLYRYGGNLPPRPTIGSCGEVGLEWRGSIGQRGVRKSLQRGSPESAVGYCKCIDGSVKVSIIDEYMRTSHAACN